MAIKKVTCGVLLSTILLSSAAIPSYAAENTGVIWEDKNYNGVLDKNEVGMSGVKMELFKIDGTLVKSSVTNEQGKYSFGDIPDGLYYAKLNFPQNYTFYGTVPYFGADGLTKYIEVTQNNLKNLNAGLVKKDEHIEEQFTWSLVGFMDNEFANIVFNPKTSELQIKCNPITPNVYFNDSNNSWYANIKVKKSTGEVLYNQAIASAQQLKAETKNIPMQVGDTIEFIHGEGDRLRFKANNGELTKLGLPYTPVTKKYEITKNAIKELQ